MSTTHNLEPATARRFVNQLKLLDSKTLQALLSRVEAWKVQAEKKHLELTQRANGGANNLRRAVAAWDEALRANVPRKALEINLHAFQRGRDEVT